METERKVDENLISLGSDELALHRVLRRSIIIIINNNLLHHHHHLPV